MTLEDEVITASALSADDAFAALGNETRLQILQTLGEAGDPLSFSELRTAVGMTDSGQFNYHLTKLAGHFITKTDDGYRLRQAGRRVIEAVLSGAVTDAPVFDRTPVDQDCPFCEAPIEIRYYQERVEMFCTECPGTWGHDSAELRGYLGYVSLPPAGLEGRTTDELFRTAWTWQHLRILAVSCGICPGCSSTLERAVLVCDEHDGDHDICPRCERRHAVQFRARCSTCHFGEEGTFSIHLAADLAILTFLTDHGINPVAPTSITRFLQTTDDYEEVVRSTDPFEAAYTFTVDGDSLTLVVDEELNVVEVTGG